MIERLSSYGTAFKLEAHDYYKVEPVLKVAQEERERLKITTDLMQ